MPWRYSHAFHRSEARRRLSVAQAGICAVCFDPAPVRLQLDHDHETDLIRGLLCPWCNVSDGRRLSLTRAWDLYVATPPAAQADVLASMATNCAALLARLDAAPSAAWRYDLHPRHRDVVIEPHAWLDGIDEEWDDESGLPPMLPCALDGCGIGYHDHPLRRFDFALHAEQRRAVAERLQAVESAAALAA